MAAEENKYCSHCGKDMTVGQTTCVGISLQWKTDNENLRYDAQKQLGKYDLDKTYQFCWECWLDSLMGVK